jgi:hypothetical protein
VSNVIDLVEKIDAAEIRRVEAAQPEIVRRLSTLSPCAQGLLLAMLAGEWIAQQERQDGLDFLKQIRRYLAARPNKAE